MAVALIKSGHELPSALPPVVEAGARDSRGDQIHDVFGEPLARLYLQGRKGLQEQLP